MISLDAQRGGRLPEYASKQVERTRQLMDAQVRDCLVEGYDSLIPSLGLPDADDRDVLAAVIVLGSQSPRSN